MNTFIFFVARVQFGVPVSGPFVFEKSPAVWATELKLLRVHLQRNLLEAYWETLV